MDKKLIASFVGVALFIVGVGLLSKKLGNKNLTFPGTSSDEKVVTINETVINVQIADTDEKRAVGLSKTEFLDSNEGMLFTFSEKDVTPSFWMKDMSFYIDIIWINDDVIVGIEKSAQPEPGKRDTELTMYRPNEPIDYVLEVAAGVSEESNFAIGDSVDLSKAL